MNDPKRTHAVDQALAYFATLGNAFAIFIREAQAAGATERQASDGACAAIRVLMTMQTPPDGAA